MKYLLKLPWLIFLFFLLFSLIQPTPASAQACTGDHGGAGNCNYSMNCPSPNIDGTGTCTDPQICCLNSIPTGGPIDCSGKCTSTADCLGSPTGFACTNNICTNASICPSCTGTSGQPGSCLSASTCAGLGHNSGDGTDSCTMGNICCTNAPTNNSCSFTLPSQFPGVAEFPVNLHSTEWNTTYRITLSPSTCTGTCFGDHSTDLFGNFRCTLGCGPPIGTYTITAQHGSVSCSNTVEILNIPGPPCTGVSGAGGWCGTGPFYCRTQGTVADGVGTCTGPDVQCCIADPSAGPFCLGGNGINTGIGCIPIDTINNTIGKILFWATMIAGGVAFILLIVAGFQLATSAGNPKRVQAAKELITSALTGLILIILAIVILNFIGVSILNLTGLGFHG